MNDYNELIERCKEICDWQDTGLLKGDALRNFAKSRPYFNQINNLSMAETETLREVADAFVVMAARVAAPVRLTDEDFARLYDEAEFDLDLHEMREAAEHMFNAIQSAVLRANGFKVDE